MDIMVIITLSSEFHSNSIRVRVPPSGVLDTRTRRQIDDTLCPSRREGCICGGGYTLEPEGYEMVEPYLFSPEYHVRRIWT